MGEFFTKTFEQMKEILSKLDKTKKIIIGVVIGVVIISFMALLSVSSGESNSLLFAKLSADEFGKVTKKLDEMGFFYDTRGAASIFVKPAKRELILTKLAQEDMIPKGIPGWKLFDLSKWTETDKELNVKYMRALRGEIKRHIQSLKNIEKASVDIAKSEDTIYTEKKIPYTAVVTIFLAPGFDKLSQKEIKGITYLISRAVGSRLKPENVTVLNDLGQIISDFDDELSKAKTEFTILENRRKIEERARVKLLKDVRLGLERIFSSDRIQIVRLNMDFNWDKISEEYEEYTPIIMTPDNPATPYSERKTKDSLVVSRKTVKEKFEGHGWNPEGPAGTDGNKPPGYKASDDQYSKYNKDEHIENRLINKMKRKVDRDPFDVTRVSVAIAIDGQQDLPRLPDGDYDLDPTKKPTQIKLTPEELKQAENIIKKAINFNESRGDQVAVENILFDRSGHWNKIREEYRRKEQMKKLILAALIGIIALFVGFIVFRSVQKEIERRRRLKEEKLALEQQRMREAALRVAEDEGIDVELSLEDRARRELLDSAVNLAKEKPDDVAALLRTWLQEE
jgi:flagellar M-ring protein FliF